MSDCSTPPLRLALRSPSLDFQGRRIRCPLSRDTTATAEFDSSDAATDFFTSCDFATMKHGGGGGQQRDFIPTHTTADKETARTPTDSDASPLGSTTVPRCVMNGVYPPVLTEAAAGSTIRYRVDILKKGVPLQRAL